MSEAPGLTPSQVAALFPYYLRVDAELRVVAFGRSLAKLCPAAAPGVLLSELFLLPRSATPHSFATLKARLEQLFFLEQRGTGVRLRGLWTLTPDAEGLLFLGSPWLTELAQLETAGLTLRDFSALDPLPDLLSLARAKDVALEDARGMAAVVAQQRDKLRETNEQLVAADAVKTRFLANTSHELRTPLAGILGMAGLLQRSPLSPGQRLHVDRLVRSAQGLQVIVNDLLDLSKLEAGKLQLEALDTELWALVQDTSELFAVSATEKGVSLTCSLAPEVPRRVLTDPTRLRQVLGNLLGNAVKFTAVGSIQLAVSAEPDAEGRARVRFEVRDSGLGIDPSKPLFQPFEQGDGSTARRFGGTGLGLSIARELVHLLGGELTAERNADVGSTFRFAVPLAVLAAPPERHYHALRGRRIMVVDAKSETAEPLLSVLASWGVEASHARSGLQALALLRAASAAKPYDALLVDSTLPDVSGLDLTLVLAGDSRFDPLRVLLVLPSERSIEGDPRLHMAKVHGFLSAPLNTSNLLDCLQALLLVGGNPSGTFAAMTPPVMHPAAALPPNAPRVLVVDDNVVNRELASAMLEELGLASDLAVGGAEALELLARRPYPLVLMDLQMPEMDGFETLRELRARPGPNAQAPVIAVSALAMREDRARALAAGMSDHLPKPYTLAELAGVLASWVKSPRLRARGSSSPPAPEAASAVRFARLEEVLALPDGATLATQLTQLFLAELGERREAVRAAFEARDAAALARAAHALRSSAVVLGAEELSQRCGALEAAGGAGALEDARGLLAAFEGACDSARAALEARLRA